LSSKAILSPSKSSFLKFSVCISSRISLIENNLSPVKTHTKESFGASKPQLKTGGFYETDYKNKG
jgi:hypothetical protein